METLPESAFNPAVFEPRRVKTYEWLSIGVPLVTGLVSTFAAMYALSSRADVEALKTTQFLLAIAGIGFAITGSVVAVQRVSERLIAERAAVPLGAEAGLVAA